MRFKKSRGVKYVAPRTFPIKKSDLPKATTSYSQRNNKFVGYEVGAGKYKKRFTNTRDADSYSNKLLKMNKGLSGSGENRGVTSKPLYFGSKF